MWLLKCINSTPNIVITIECNHKPLGLIYNRQRRAQPWGTVCICPPCVVKKLVWFVRINAFGIQRFSAHPLVCSAPGAESKSAGGQKQKQGGQKHFSRPSGAILPPLKKFSAPAKINSPHATELIGPFMQNCTNFSVVDMNPDPKAVDPADSDPTDPDLHNWYTAI